MGADEPWHAVVWGGLECKDWGVLNPSAALKWGASKMKTKSVLCLKVLVLVRILATTLKVFYTAVWKTR